MRTLAMLATLLAPAAVWAQETDPLLTSMETMVQRAAKKADALTVGIWVSRDPERGSRGGGVGPLGARPADPFLKRPKDSPASGTILESDGYIVTSYFNVSGTVHSIKVFLPGGQEREAKVVGYHQPADIALLKIEEAGLPVFDRAPLGQVRVGVPVVAVGRAPDARGLTVNPGVVSALARMSGRCTQVDAKLNYGNVGGPLVDSAGRLIGITCKIDTRHANQYGPNSGVSFALTWDQLDRMLPALKKGENVKRDALPFMGVVHNREAPVDDGVAVGSVVAGGSAEAAGVKPGDVILEFNGMRTENFNELRMAIAKVAVGDKVNVKLRRGTDELTIELTVGENPNGE